MFASVQLFSPPFGPLVYSLPAYLPEHYHKIGMRVLAPLGKRFQTGFIAAIKEESGLSAGTACKPILFPLEAFPLLSDEIITVVQEQAHRQGQRAGEVWRNILPAGLRSSKIRIFVPAANTVYSEQDIIKLEDKEKELLAQKILNGGASYIQGIADKTELEQYGLACDPPWPLRPAARKQRELLDYLHDHGTQSARQLRSVFGAPIMPIVRKLVEKKLIELSMSQYEEKEELLPPPEKEFQLNQEQRQVREELLRCLCSQEPAYQLLHGITGSGKTSVYMELARECLKMNRSVLLLAPEVALAHKLFQDVGENLPDFKRFLYHGYQPPPHRENTYRKIRESKDAVIVVGTRSAIFLPVFRPGCIILDEEHDSSYKQDEKLSYHAREIAWLRTKLNNGLLILGSATPDIRTYYAAENASLGRLQMFSRATGGGLPAVSISRLGTDLITDPHESALSGEMEQALIECMNRGEQAVVLLNRRGYAPLVYCVSCQDSLKCPHCQIGLSFHKTQGRAVCHFCGYKLEWPASCPHCGGNNFITMGEGTERIAERLEVLAGAPVLRMDRDSVRRSGKIQEILTRFSRGESPFLVGTQMLSKGHHFPNVTLVAIADGDIGLNLPDYRAAERTFQLVVQAAGRAGRGMKPGRALIQTRNPEHYCWKYIAQHDYEGFYKAELARRRKYQYPPFVKLGLLRITFPVGVQTAEEMWQELGRYLRSKAREMKVKFMGPVAAPIGIINGKRRMHCLMKADSWDGMRKLYYLAASHEGAKHLHIFLDLDPVDMM